MNRVTGREIGLPLIAEVGIAQSQIAQRITWHSHAGRQLLFMLGGATTYEFRQQGLRTLDLSGEHFAVIPPGVVHRGVQDMRPPCDLFFVIVAPDAAKHCRHTPFNATEWRWIEQLFRQARVAAHPLNPGLRRLVNSLAVDMRTVARRQNHLERARFRARVCEVLLEAADQLTRASTTMPNALVLAAEEHLRKHLDQKLRMVEVARHLGVSRARLFDAFKRGTGMTPNDYLLRLRVEQGREWLAAPERTVTDIAFEAGFASSQYFSTVFRKYTGQTPMEYRQSLLVTPAPGGRRAPRK